MSQLYRHILWLSCLKTDFSLRLLFCFFVDLLMKLELLLKQNWPEGINAITWRDFVLLKLKWHLILQSSHSNGVPPFQHYFTVANWALHLLTEIMKFWWGLKCELPNRFELIILTSHSIMWLGSGDGFPEERYCFHFAAHTCISLLLNRAMNWWPTCFQFALKLT